jgi:hypothetical protein
MKLELSHNKIDMLGKQLTGMCMRAGVFLKLPVAFTHEMPHGFTRYAVDPSDGKVICVANRRIMTDKDIGI